MNYEKQKELDTAIEMDDLELATKLVDLQDINDRHLPLEHACRYDRTAIAKMFVEKGAYIHDDFNSLAYASRHGNLELMQFFYEHANNIGDSYNWASLGESLQDAVRSGNIEAVRFLLERNADPNYVENPTPLEAAADTENMEIAKLLVSYGADPRAGNSRAFKVIRGKKRLKRLNRKTLAILEYYKSVARDWPLYKAIVINQPNKINKLMVDEPRQFSKETRAWLKHGCTNARTPGFEHAQKIYRLGILNHKLNRKLNRPTTNEPTTKAKVKKI